MKEKIKQIYAHSLENRPPEEWQLLESHLKHVSDMASEFAKYFGGDQWASLAGLWHDLGKYSDEFQAKLFRENGVESHLETKPGRVIHSQAGGHLVSLKGWKGVDRLLSWLIMGHHAGLTDFYSEQIAGKALEPKMCNPEVSQWVFDRVPSSILNQTKPTQPFPKGSDTAFFIRMLFSCLVDADFLDTEAFMDKSKADSRSRRFPSLISLKTAMDSHMNALCRDVSPTPVNQIRAKILEECREKALTAPTVFSLTVPTGGGKTLASLTFALDHAVKHGLRRIIYVIPYTSIIEQTVEVFKKIPGFSEAVIEHHYNVAEVDEAIETVPNRLAAENWDAPIIVTTAVQFFESLYSCRTSRCRKLHNIADSVVIFDEAQCLPPAYLRPIVFAIRELYRHYSVTPILCTATQPVLTRVEAFDFKFREGFDDVEEIISDPEKLGMKLKRVEISLLFGSIEPVSLEKLTESILAEGASVLCIVNRREDARQVSQLLPDERTFHLSTNMCAEHRSEILARIRSRLKEGGEPFFVISTSLVEAGVDLDFPIVYRAMAGLDSIAQAAGRCNREGRLEGLGRTVIFVPERQPRYVSQPAGIMHEMIRAGSLSTLLSPESYKTYFQQRFWQLGDQSLDRKQILNEFSGRMTYGFRTAAEKFKLIEDDWQEPVVVPYGESVNLIDLLSKTPLYPQRILRKLGRYSVGIPKMQVPLLLAGDFLRETSYPGVRLLDPTVYHPHFGYVPPDESIDIDPECFFA